MKDMLKKNGGVYVENLSNDDYHADKEFYSSSQLKKAIDSFGNFRYQMENKEDFSSKLDSPMTFGSLVHCLLLEPHLLDEEFAFLNVDGLNLRTKADKAIRDNFIAANKGKINTRLRL